MPILIPFPFHHCQLHHHALLPSTDASPRFLPNAKPDPLQEVAWHPRAQAFRVKFARVGHAGASIRQGVVRLLAEGVLNIQRRSDNVQQRLAKGAHPAAEAK
eukprot:3182214-Pyramimonas_sp.AAC.1